MPNFVWLLCSRTLRSAAPLHSDLVSSALKEAVATHDYGMFWWIAQVGIFLPGAEFCCIAGLHGALHRRRHCPRPRSALLLHITLDLRRVTLAIALQIGVPVLRNYASAIFCHALVCNMCANVCRIPSTPRVLIVADIRHLADSYEKGAKNVRMELFALFSWTKCQPFGPPLCPRKKSKVWGPEATKVQVHLAGSATPSGDLQAFQLGTATFRGLTSSWR